MKNKLEEKAIETNRCKNLSDLIDVLVDMEQKFGNVNVGKNFTLNPSVDVSFFENGNRPILIID